VAPSGERLRGKGRYGVICYPYLSALSVPQQKRRYINPFT